MRGLVVGRGDPDGRVLPAGGGAADQEREVEPQPLHLPGDVHHLVQRRRDQSREAHQVAVLVDGGLKDLLRRHHHAEVDDVVAVAAEHDADDVLADVVNVALHRGHHDLALGSRPARAAVLLHEGLQVGHRLLHRPGALHHLGQEHLPGAEQVADDAHPVHQRPLDHAQGAPVGESRLLGVLDDEVVHAVDQCVGEALLDASLSPAQIHLALLPGALHGLGELHHALGGVGPAIEDEVLDPLEEILRNLLVDLELAGVHDAHVHPGGDGVVEEGRVDRLADAVVAAEGEGEVGDPAADQGPGQRSLISRVASMKFRA